MKRIAVLLAAYNGEKYIRRLIDSLCQQSLRNFTIYIHDDGSLDSTMEIINSYNDERIHLLHDTQHGRGAKGSFIWLLENVEADYYMFCDQDDFWLPHKIEQSVYKMEVLEKDHPDIPICLHTDLAVVDANCNIIEKSLWELSKVKPSILENKDYIQVFNCVTGCTMIFNQKAKECSLPFNEISPMHDFWVAYSTLANGGILSHLPYSTVLYCQHGDNEVGANDVGIKYIFNKLSQISNIYFENIEKYKVMHQISGISLRRYLFCKINYEIRRLI